MYTADAHSVWAVSTIVIIIYNVQEFPRFARIAGCGTFYFVAR